MLIRALRPSDLVAVKELLHQLGYDIETGELAKRINGVLADPTHFVVVANAAGGVCGLVHAFERPALEKSYDVVVQSLVVDQRARKTGIGKQLMAAAETWARTRGVHQVVLYTRIDRDDARLFYERTGYRWSATSHLMTKSVGHR
jgi:GNAT superfamily N-acetyltransferase